VTTPFDTLTQEQEQLIRRTITRNLSDDEHALFIEAAQRSGLDPFARHIYPLRKKDGLVIEATIDGLRLSAERTGKYAGQLGPEWCGPDGVWRDIWICEEPPVAARVGILRCDFKEPVWGKAVFNEFFQEGEFWRGMPVLMIAKCAEALAFRKAFPREFAGLYTPEEMSRSAAGERSHLAQGDRLDSGTVAPVSDRPALPSEGPRPAGHAGDRKPGVDSERGDSALRVPPPLQPFFEAGLSNRRNLQAAFEFVRKELDVALGDGTATFRRIYSKHLGHGLFTSRAKCEQANRACLIELWGAVEGAQRRDAA
jgi:phage recombination protein Bet